MKPKGLAKTLLGTSALAAAIVVSFVAPSASALSDTWTGTTDTAWATSTNWLGGNVPGTGDTATFNDAGNGNTTIDLGSGVTLGALVFDTSSTAAYTIGSGGAGSQTLTLGTVGNAITMNSTVANNELINANLALATTSTAATPSTYYTVANNSATNTLTLAGGISASTAGNKVLAVNGSGNTTISGAISAGSGAVNLVKLGTGTLTLSGGGALGGNFITAYGGTNGSVLLGGTTKISTGTYTSAGEFVVGGVLTTGGAGVNTNFTMDGGSLAISSYLSLGRGNGVGAVSSDIVLNNAASVTASNFSAGFNNGSTSNLPKGTFTLNDTSSFASSGAFILGESQGSNITMTLNGSSTVSANGTGIKYVGHQSGNGTLNINGGTFTSGGEVRVSGSASNGAFNGTGTINLNSGSATVASMTINRGNSNTFAGTGVVNVNGGTFTSTGDVVVSFAGSASSTGTLNIAGGTFNVGTTTAQKLNVGYWDPVKSNVNVSSGNLNLNTNSSIRFTEGGNGTSVNTFTMSGGNVTFYSDNATTVGGTGTLNLAAAATANFTNTFNLNGGTLTVPQIMATATGNGSRIFNFNGGTLKAATDGQTLMTATAATRANVRNGGAIIDTNGKNVTVAQALLHSNIGGDNAIDGGLAKNGLGTLTLSGANTYTGVTNINVGTLALASTGSLASTQITAASGSTFDVSAVSGYTVGSGVTLTNNGTVNGSFTVASGATLNGSGTFSGAVAVNGNLNPGNSPGSQTYAAGLTLGAATVTTMEIAGSGGVAGTDFDFINVTGGTMTNDGSLTIVDFGGYDISAQTSTYNLFDFVANTGDFDVVTVDGTSLTYNVGTDDWSATAGDATYNFAEGTGVLSVTVVPEPTAALLGGLGMLGLLRRRRVA
jgi:MYXO-CTERM domain-containing protein